MNVVVINIKNYEDNDYIYCGRPSKWGNPYSSKESNIAQERVGSKDEAIKKYKQHILDNIHLVDELIIELKEKNLSKLGCWCSPKKCHSEILVELINERKYKSIF